MIFLKIIFIGENGTFLKMSTCIHFDDFGTSIFPKQYMSGGNTKNNQLSKKVLILFALFLFDMSCCVWDFISVVLKLKCNDYPHVTRGHFLFANNILIVHDPL